MASGFAVVAAIGALGFILALTLDRTPRAFTLGVTSGGPVVEMRGGQVACQRPVDVPEGGAFDRIRLKLGTYGRPGPPLDVTVHRSDGEIVAHGVLAGGYPDITVNPTYTVALDHEIESGTRSLSVCVQDGGRSRVALYGNGDAANGSSTAYLDGQPKSVDMDIVFERRSRSYASELGAIAGRAVLFRSPRLSGTIYLLVLLALVLGAGAALVAAARGIDADADGEPDARPVADERPPVGDRS